MVIFHLVHRSQAPADSASSTQRYATTGVPEPFSHSGDSSRRHQLSVLVWISPEDPETRIQMQIPPEKNQGRRLEVPLVARHMESAQGSRPFGSTFCLGLALSPLLESRAAWGETAHSRPQDSAVGPARRQVSAGGEGGGEEHPGPWFSSQGEEAPVDEFPSWGLTLRSSG